MTVEFKRKILKNRLRVISGAQSAVSSFAYNSVFMSNSKFILYP